MGDKIYPTFLITFLRDNVPIAMVTVQQDGDASESVEVYHQDTEGLSLAQEKCVVASDGLAFLLWKLTGSLPEPRGYEPADETPVAPF